jgi:hypothetical protein
MSRLHKVSVLASILAVALAASAIAIATTDGRGTQPQPATAAAAGATTGGGQARASRTTHHWRGRITSADRGDRWFRMHTTTNTTVRIYTNHGTRWDDCDWGDMRYGQYVDVHAYRSHGHWIATRMGNWHDHGNGDDGWDDGHMMR